MVDLDIHFFFISILFIIWTWQVHEWEDISKLTNTKNIIWLFTVLHIVAKQPIIIAKSHWYAPFGGCHGYKEHISDVIFNATPRQHIFIYIDHQKVIC